MSDHISNDPSPYSAPPIESRGRHILTWSDFKQPPESTTGPCKDGYDAFLVRELAPAADPVTGIQDMRRTRVRMIEEESCVNLANIPPERQALTLKHEQGHLDLAYICGAGLEQLLQSSPAEMVDSIAKVESIADPYIQACNAKQRQYDYEVDHGRNDEEQAKWNQHIHDNLIHYGFIVE